MKHRYLLSYLMLIMLICAVETQAQEQRIGYVNSDQILDQLPEYSGIEQQLRAISTEWENQLDKMDQEIEDFQENFEAKEILYSKEQRKQEEEKLERLIQERQDFAEEKFGDGGDYFLRQEELLESLQRKVFQAIEVVANRRDINFVFDRAQNNSMLVADEQWNLNEEVLEELGITLNDTSN